MALEIQNETIAGTIDNLDSFYNNLESFYNNLDKENN